MTDGLRADIEEKIEGAGDEELANHAGDPGLLGTIVRETLTERGHHVLYSDVNGVQNANVTLKDQVEEERIARGDSQNLLDGSNQTLGQQKEGVTDIDPTRVQGEQESGAGMFARGISENDRTDREIPSGPIFSGAAREDGDEGAPDSVRETEGEGDTGDDEDDVKTKSDDTTPDDEKKDDAKGAEKRSGSIFRR